MSTFRTWFEDSDYVQIRIKIRRGDENIMHHIADAISNPLNRTQVRRVLAEFFVDYSQQDLKTLLASAPLQGLKIERNREPGRRIEL